MLPYSSIDFFLVMIFNIIFLVLCRQFIPDKYYKYVLALLNATYLVVIYPSPLHFFVLIFYSYLFTYLLQFYFRFRLKIWGILILLIPMLTVKFDIRFGSYPFELNNLLSFAGLSFACFRTVSYYMDISKESPRADFVTYFNYLSFTPTLLIGPIERFSRFGASQSQGFTAINSANSVSALNYIVKGVAFKYILAEITARYWLDSLPAQGSFLYHFGNMYAYYVYLFFDFAGYSFMALGFGKFMGIDVPLNFKNPFLAVNPQDFWRNFHITLGDWLKDYLFTPVYIYLSRKKRLKSYNLLRQNSALLVTFIVMGCWNGFSWNFILSGLMFGIYSAVHNTYTVLCRRKSKDIVFGKLKPVYVKIISIFVMLNLASAALYVFSGRCF